MSHPHLMLIKIKVVVIKLLRLILFKKIKQVIINLSRQHLIHIKLRNMVSNRIIMVILPIQNAKIKRTSPTINIMIINIINQLIIMKPLNKLKVEVDQNILISIMPIMMIY